MVNTCRYASVKTHRMYNTKNKFSCKLCTLKDNDMSCWSMECNEVTTLTQDIDGGGSYS